MIAIVTLSDAVILFMFIVLFLLQIHNAAILRRTSKYSLYVFKRIENAIDTMIGE